MKFAHFFIDRPVFAAVLSIVTIVVGVLAIFNLPIAQYPEITPPTIIVTTSYPGANAKGRRRDGSHAYRGAGQRRGKHVVHVQPMHE